MTARTLERRLTQWLSIVTIAVFALTLGLVLADFVIGRHPQATTGAWVLWEERVVGDAREWRVISPPYEGRPACERAASDQNDSEFSRLLVSDEPADKILRALANFSCFPDTLDPRGPKGK
jgi:hypothetical protein